MIRVLALVAMVCTGCVSDVRRSVARATQCREYIERLPDGPGETSCPRPDQSMFTVNGGTAIICRCEGLTVQILAP